MTSLNPGMPARNPRPRSDRPGRSVTEPCPDCDYPIVARHRQRVRSLFDADCLLCHTRELNSQLHAARQQLAAARQQLAAARSLVRQLPAAELTAILAYLNSQPMTF